VFALKPDKFALTGEALVPDPADCAVVAVKVESVLDVPHSNHAVVEAPFGLTVPFTVAELVVTEPAAAVTTAGSNGTVVKLQTADQPLVPPVFFALTRQ
jgi:hypothetical protein